MYKSLKVLVKILRFLCIGFIVWFTLYFFFGNQFSITFTNRCFAYWFPQILVFTTSASIYLLFIFAILSARKRWQNVLLFFGGVLVATLPLLLYHGYLQYQCGIWNKEAIKEIPLYVNKNNNTESVKVITSHCHETVSTDTVFVKELTPWFELQNPVSIIQSENGNWTIVR